MGAVTIYGPDIERLDPPEYLNDNLIDLKVKYLIDNLDEGKRRKVYAFSCLFYDKYCQASKPHDSHALVARWTKNVDLFEKEVVLVPINLDMHWSLMVVLNPLLITVC